MTWIKIIQLLPELIELIKSIQKAIDESETERKVRDDVKAISEAFKSRDATKLRSIFKLK
jgi:hypothetical protein